MEPYNNPDHTHGHLPTDMVTAVAEKTGLRPFMLRLAFRDGLLNKRAFVNGPATVEAGSAVSLVVAVGTAGVEALNKHELNPAVMVAVGAAGVALYGVNFVSRQFKSKAEEEAARIDRYFKKEVEAIHTILGQGRIWKESDAHVVGRGISYESYYLKRNINLLNFTANADAIIGNRPGDVPPLSEAEPQMIGTTQEASDVSDKNELRDDMVRSYARMKLLADVAFRERIMRPDGKIGRYYTHCLLTPIDDHMELLGLKNTGTKLYEAVKLAQAKRPGVVPLSPPALAK